MLLPDEIRQVLKSLAYDRNQASIVFVMRGLPGCGKSWLTDNIAKWCWSENITCKVCSADHWFSRDGHYRWEKQGLTDAHAHSRGTFLYWMQQNTRVIVIDNTNLHTEDYMYYVSCAAERGYEAKLVEFRTLLEDEMYFVVNRSRVNVATYDYIGRMWDIEWDDDAIVLRPGGMDRRTDQDEEVIQENHRRGYM